MATPQRTTLISRILPSIPRDPVGRFRLLSLWFALFATIGTMVDLGLVSSIPEPSRTIGLSACVALSIWFLWGHHRRRFPEFATPFEAILLIAVGSASSMPLRAMGVFFAACQFRALYVTRREFLLLPISFGAARALSIVFAAQPSAYPALSLTVFLQVAALIIISSTLYLLVASIDRQTLTERALQRSEERYRLLAAATHDMVYDWNVRTQAVEHTDAIHMDFGFSDADVSHDRSWWLGRIDPADRPAYDAAIDALFASESGVSAGIRYRIRRGDGAIAMVLERAVLQRDATGAPVRVIGSVRDVTTEDRLEEQLRQAQKMEAIGQLAGGAAHDFNNLLTVIGGHVFMIEQLGSIGPIAERHLQGIATAAERAGALTRQLLAFGRRQVMKPAVLDLNAMVTRFVESIAPLVGDRIRVITRLDEKMAPVLADAGQLEQVLVNLALNAREAMPDGGTLTITTNNTPVADSGHVRLSFSDTGVGMSEETRSHLFEPFFTTKSGKGTGLGLATAYGIVKQSFGDIVVDSTPGKGSTFTIVLPVAQEALISASLARRSVPPDGVFDIGSAKRVLLVEDDNDVRDFAREVLTRMGYKVFPARNGLDGIAVAKSQGYAFGLVVTDIVMPEMGGRQMVMQLRQVRPDLRVLYISGYADDPEARREVGAGEEVLLEKPFTARTLQEAVTSMGAKRATP